MTSPAEQAPSTAADGRLRQGGRVLLMALYTALRSLKLYPVEIDPNVRPLGGVLEWANRDGNEISVGIFVEVR